MKLSELQTQFTKMLALLVQYAATQGLDLTLGRGYASAAANLADGGHKRSLHLDRLAQDYNVFMDGAYLQGDAAKAAHNHLHDFWDSIGGAERIESDLNHYSLAYRGMR